MYTATGNFAYTIEISLAVGGAGITCTPLNGYNSILNRQFIRIMHGDVYLGLPGTPTAQGETIQVTYMGCAATSGCRGKCECGGRSG